MHVYLALWVTTEASSPCTQYSVTPGFSGKTTGMEPGALDLAFALPLGD